MLAEERQRMILELLEEKGAVSVAELCRQTAASEATVRRDLNELDRQGRLSKVHGGAVLPEEEFDGRESDIPTKLMLYAEEKRRIAKYAAAQVKDEDFVFIDAGSTTLGMADFLQHSKATFVTNGIECAGRLAQKGLRVYLTGGLLKPVTQALVGAAALESLRKYHFTKAFIGTNGISIKQGFTTPDTEEAFIKSTAIERAYAKYVLADSSKFGKISGVSICPLEQAHILTDRVPDPIYFEKTMVVEVEQP